MNLAPCQTRKTTERLRRPLHKHQGGIMKKIRIGIFVLLVAFFQLAIADSDSEKEAEILLNTMGMESAMDQSMSQMLDLQLQQNPALAPYRNVMVEFFRKHISWTSLKPAFLEIYTEAFTAEELREINAFYATDTGKKTIEKMPLLMTQGGQIGISRVQDNIEELQEMIKIESERLVDLQQQ
jgi:hypothetical protein